ncbi:unnamed protein product [Amoebophrya sp. A120]|nr:unnamed protein product [Amoebophrya sp. A120]|eukprot:GSA120T00012376001.1
MRSPARRARGRLTSTYGSLAELLLFALLGLRPLVMLTLPLLVRLTVLAVHQDRSSQDQTSRKITTTVDATAPDEQLIRVADKVAELDHDAKTQQLGGHERLLRGTKVTSDRTASTATKSRDANGPRTFSTSGGSSVITIEADSSTTDTSEQYYAIPNTVWVEVPLDRFLWTASQGSGDLDQWSNATVPFTYGEQREQCPADALMSIYPKEYAYVVSTTKTTDETNCCSAQNSADADGSYWWEASLKNGEERYISKVRLYNRKGHEADLNNATLVIDGDTAAGTDIGVISSAEADLSIGLFDTGGTVVAIGKRLNKVRITKTGTPFSICGVFFFVYMDEFPDTSLVATQSSNYSSNLYYNARVAITNQLGKFPVKTSHTYAKFPVFWQLEFASGKAHWVDQIRLVNRGDCCQERTNHLQVYFDSAADQDPPTAGSQAFVLNDTTRTVDGRNGITSTSLLGSMLRIERSFRKMKLAPPQADYINLQGVSVYYRTNVGPDMTSTTTTTTSTTSTPMKTSAPATSSPTEDGVKDTTPDAGADVGAETSEGEGRDKDSTKLRNAAIVGASVLLCVILGLILTQQNHETAGTAADEHGDDGEEHETPGADEVAGGAGGDEGSASFIAGASGNFVRAGSMGSINYTSGFGGGSASFGGAGSSAATIGPGSSASFGAGSTTVGDQSAPVGDSLRKTPNASASFARSGSFVVGNASTGGGSMVKSSGFGGGSASFGGAGSSAAFGDGSASFGASSAAPVGDQSAPVGDSLRKTPNASASFGRSGSFGVGNVSSGSGSMVKSSGFGGGSASFGGAGSSAVMGPPSGSASFGSPGPSASAAMESGSVAFGGSQATGGGSVAIGGTSIAPGGESGSITGRDGDRRSRNRSRQ